MDSLSKQTYGERVRPRVCGICIKGDAILLVNHRGLYGHDFWAPPGGGIDFGLSAESNLVREFKEETGVDVEIVQFLFACEFIQKPLHAIELFFEVRLMGGKLQQGSDPEMPKERQVIHSVGFMNWNDVKSLPEGHLHGAFSHVRPPEKIAELRGYIRI